MTTMKKLLSYLLIIALCMVGVCSSCTTQKVPTRAETEFHHTELLQPDINDARIVDISKNGKKYKIVDGHGHKAGKLKADTIDARMIGTWLICLSEFK